MADTDNRAHLGAIQRVHAVVLARIELLRRKAVALDGRRAGFDGALVTQAGEGAPLTGKFTGIQLEQAKVFPRIRLILPAVEFQHVGQDKAGLLLPGAFIRINRYPIQQPVF